MLRTPGGSVVAYCEVGMVWVDVLGPAPGFHVEDAQQGPDVQYRVTFKTDGQEIRVVLHCGEDLVPTAETTTGQR